MSARVRIVLVALALAAPAWSCKPTTTTNPTPTGPTTSASFENPGGMWMPTQMASHAEQLKSLGLGYDPGALGDPTSFPLGAIVSLGGCSASFVSDEGLVITNHHCVIGALQTNSTAEHNLLQTGYLAATRADERPAGPAQHVYVTQSITDVTKEMTQGLDAIADAKARFAEIQTRVARIESQCQQAHAGHACSVRPFFEGAEYYLVDALDIRDVRLVYAPDAGIGVFGGEIDNWRWPRHTGDFAMLRAYVGPDGAPADPSPANVPYKPKHRLRVASEPLEAGDFVMVAGYPGRTNRLSTADEVKDAVAWRYPRDIARFGETIALLEKLGKERPELAIKAASRLRRMANYYTNYQGMLEGLQKGGLADQKAKLEADLKAWIDADAARKAKYGGVFDELAAIDAEYRKTRDRDAALRELAESSYLFAAAMVLVTGNPPVSGPAAPPAGERKAAIEGILRNYDPDLDRALLVLALQRAAKLPEGTRPDEVLTAFVGKDLSVLDDPAKLDAAVAKLYKSSKLGDAKARAKLVDGAKRETLERSKDGFIRAAVVLEGAFKEMKDRDDARGGAMAVLRPKFVAALREFSKTPLAPDANSTLRITYGTVRGYKPTPDAAVYDPFTTLAQMIAKHTGTEPFALPPTILAAAKADKGPYVAAALGDVPLDFLADLDITGGNSGSATLNAKGELVGLAFDGNYEAIASNWIFVPGITRSIHVDVRFIEWMLDAVDEGDHLLREMGVEPKLAAVKADGAAAPAPSPTPTPAPAAASAAPAAH